MVTIVQHHTIKPIAENRIHPTWFCCLFLSLAFWTQKGSRCAPRRPDGRVGWVGTDSLSCLWENLAGMAGASFAWVLSQMPSPTTPIPGLLLSWVLSLPPVWYHPILVWPLHPGKTQKSLLEATSLKDTIEATRRKILTTAGLMITFWDLLFLLLSINKAIGNSYSSSLLFNLIIHCLSHLRLSSFLESCFFLRAKP